MPTPHLRRIGREVSEAGSKPGTPTSFYAVRLRGEARLKLGSNLALLQSPPSQQGADRTLTFRPGPGPGPFAHKHPASGLPAGQLSAGRRQAAGVCGPGEGQCTRACSSEALVSYRHS